MSEFKSLSAAIAEWVEHPLDQLPAELKTRVESAFIASWDGLTDEQRLSVANQWDDQHDPANEEARQNWWDFFGRKQKWEAIPTPTATDLDIQESRLESLQRKYEAMSDEDGEHYPKADNESPEQRQQRLKAWYKEEGQKGPGALKRTAEREDITRQTLQGILKRP